MQGFNLQKMMKQAQEMQKKAQGMQEDLERAEYTGVSGGGAVTVVFNGKNEIKSIKLKKEAINAENPESVDDETVEMLEDLILSAISDVNNKVSSALQDKMSTLTGGLNIPGLF
ncbi:MAG: YbaB/EbfC family nucleoid-associated protein [bacterium]